MRYTIYTLPARTMQWSGEAESTRDAVRKCRDAVGLYDADNPDVAMERRHMEVLEVVCGGHHQILAAKDVVRMTSTWCDFGDLDAAAQEAARERFEGAGVGDGYIYHTDRFGVAWMRHQNPKTQARIHYSRMLEQSIADSIGIGRRMAGI